MREVKEKIAKQAENKVKKAKNTLRQVEITIERKEKAKVNI